MNQVGDDPRLRERYDALLRQLQHDSARHAETDALLRRIVQRLCLAARGLGDELDKVLDRIARASRDTLEVEPLDALLAQLSNAVARTAPPVLSVAHGHAGDDDVALRRALGVVVDRLALDDTLAARAGEIRQRLEAASGLTPVVEACAALGELVAAQRERLQVEKADVQRLLLQVDTRLHEFVSYLRGEEDQRRRAQANRDALDADLRGEVEGLSDSVREADSLASLKQQVAGRLAIMDRHLQVFRTRETERSEQYRKRAERMRQRVERLEHETRSLQASLAREQIAASTDALSGVPNRLAYEQRIALEFKRWKRFGRPLSIAVWDIDHFKAINDRVGHRGGDRAIRAVAQLLSKQLRETDFVARYGGEEFVTVLVDTGAEAAQVACEKLRAAIAALRIDGGGEPITLTVSGGIAEFRADDTPDSVFERADQAMYRAKESGRDRCEVG